MPKNSHKGDNPTILVREAERNELSDIAQLIATVIKESYPAIYGPKVIDFFLRYHHIDELRAQYSNSFFLIACITDLQRDIPVACGFLKGNEVKGVYVHPSYQQIGIGTMLVKSLLVKAFANVVECLWLEATPISLRLYQNLGFTITEEKVMYIDDEPLPFYKMSRHLAIV